MPIKFLKKKNLFILWVIFNLLNNCSPAPIRRVKRETHASDGNPDDHESSKESTEESSKEATEDKTKELNFKNTKPIFDSMVVKVFDVNISQIYEDGETLQEELTFRNRCIFDEDFTCELSDEDKVRYF